MNSFVLWEDAKLFSSLLSWEMMRLGVKDGQLSKRTVAKSKKQMIYDEREEDNIFT